MLFGKNRFTDECNDILITPCCYCGTKGATTRDHVPPKAIINKPRPDDLITVPCCFECNNQASSFDEKFKAYLGMHIARQGGEAERLFKEGVLPTAKHNRKLRKNIFNSMYPVNIATKAGIITGKGIAVPWDNEAHDMQYSPAFELYSGKKYLYPET